jgi:DNA (cytosine-5)-methyltransferase 1
MQPKWIVWENVPGVLSSGKGRDFGTFLGALGELGYGFAYRILDAQWFGVAQRRRRVFVVGHLGDWRRAAAVLFEPESVFGNPPTRGAKGQDAAGSTGDGVARCVTTGESRRQDWETCNFVAGTLNANGKAAGSATQQDEEQGLLVATRGIPDPAYAISAGQQGKGGVFGSGRDSQDTFAVVAFHPTQDPISSMDGSTHAMGCGLKGGCCTQAVAFSHSAAANSHGVAYVEEGTPPLRGGGAGNSMPAVAQAMAVRRLTPRECERLQGFPDDYTLVEYRKKPAADGPRYRALGNSMAVPVMRWIGERIAMVDRMA